uniref:Ephrin RBD domain-containing protein n=1 Tax=Ditylenchus dipsaci TaxID=166011 RepID=A0A915DWB2_9BILA
MEIRRGLQKNGTQPTRQRNNSPRFQEGLSSSTFLTYAVSEHDAMDFLCPLSISNSSTKHKNLNTWLSTCAIPGVRQFLSSLHSIGQQEKKKVVFRQFSPTPDAIVFTPGTSYYFISTSNGSLAGLHNTQRGLCYSKNMRLKIDFASSGVIPEKETTTDQMEFIIEERAEYSMSPPSSAKQEVVSWAKGSRTMNHAVRGGTGEIRFPTDDSRFPNVDGVNVIKKPRFVSSGSKGRKKDNYPDNYLHALGYTSTTTSLPNLSNELDVNSVLDTNEFMSLKGSENHARRIAPDDNVNAARIPKMSHFSYVIVIIFAVFLL